MGKIDNELLLFVEEALTHGFDCISDGDHSPFILIVTPLCP
ncbi:MAG: hypothetical protein ACREHD_11915 [Pirellulales bacterium]